MHVASLRQNKNEFDNTDIVSVFYMQEVVITELMYCTNRKTSVVVTLSSRLSAAAESLSAVGTQSGRCSCRKVLNSGDTLRLMQLQGKLQTW